MIFIVFRFDYQVDKSLKFPTVRPKTEYAFTSSFGIFSSQALWIAVPKAVYSLPEK
jgi:hypothetical protein